jgi:hypothetical protein
MHEHDKFESLPQNVMRDVARVVSEDITRDLQRNPENALNIMRAMHSNDRALPSGFPSPDNFFNFDESAGCSKHRESENPLRNLIERPLRDLERNGGDFIGRPLHDLERAGRNLIERPLRNLANDHDETSEQKKTQGGHGGGGSFNAIHNIGRHLESFL